ncbi:MAG: lipoprotein [Methylotenera sp.]
MPKLFFCVVAMCLSCSALTGCGTKGPLYIPEQRYPQKDSTQEVPKTAPQASPEAITPSKEY